MPNTTLEESLLRAIAQCNSAVQEEEGGVIVSKDDTSFQFIKLANSNIGTDTAHSLWTADPKEYGKKVISTFRDGWRQYASFHTHPLFEPFPSTTDLTMLFQSFKVNFIYSNMKKQLMKYTWSDDGSEIEAEEVLL